MNADHQEPITLHANQEHAGVRIAVLVVLVASFVAFFLGINLLLNSLGGTLASYSLVLSCLGALPITFAIGALVEYWLKKRWPSGQQVRLHADGLEAVLNNGDEISVDWSARFNVLKWHFSLKGYARGGRERRVPSSHHCLAIQVQQDDDRLVVHGYMPTKDLEELVNGKEYREIKPAEYAEGGALRRWAGSTDRPKIPTEVLVGDKGPIWLAERRRWQEGLELEKEDLKLFAEIIEVKHNPWNEFTSG